MNLKRLVTGVVSASLLSVTPLVLAAAPANAATYTTQVKMNISYSKIEAGRTVSISGDVVTTQNGQVVRVPTGSATLQRRLAGSSSWTNLETDAYGNSFYFYPVKAVQNATYRVVYNGGTYDGHTFTTAVGERNLQVTRKLSVKTKYGSLVARGKISPDFKKKRFTVEVKRGKWKRYTKVKTNKKGAYSVKLQGNRKGIKYRFVIPASTKFAKTQSGVLTARRY